MFILWQLQPIESVIVSSVKAMAFYMLELGNLLKCPLQLLQGQIQGVIINVLAS